MKKVSFETGAKEYDGASMKVKVYKSVVLDFLRNKFADPFRVLWYVKNDLKLLEYIIEQVMAVKEDLENIETDMIISAVMEIPEEVVRTKGVLIRCGARNSYETLSTSHLPYLNILYSVLVETRGILNMTIHEEEEY